MRFLCVFTAFLLLFTAYTPGAQAGDDSVVVINPFTAPAGKEKDALAMWEKARDFLSAQPGYISTRLHRALSPDAQYALINVAEWESAEAFHAAIEAMIAADVMKPVEGMKAAPELYRVIRR